MGADTIRLDGAAATYLRERFVPAVADFRGAVFPHAHVHNCWEALNLSQAQWVQAMHQAYLAVGVEVLSTNTINANSISLQPRGLAAYEAAINTQAVRIARQAIDAQASNTKVAGAIGPGPYLLSCKPAAQPAMQAAWRQQAKLLIAAGADMLLLETMPDSTNALLATQAVCEAQAQMGSHLPVWLSLSLKKGAAFYAGSDLYACYAQLQNYPLQALGLNCMPPNAHTLDSLKALAAISRFPLLFYPNAGLPNAQGRYALSAKAFRQYMSHAQRHVKLSVVGGCCGTEPDFVAKIPSGNL